MKQDKKEASKKGQNSGSRICDSESSQSEI
jgi:ribosome assembly protein YihI (activator of Der GTPase)